MPHTPLNSTCGVDTVPDTVRVTEPCTIGHNKIYSQIDRVSSVPPLIKTSQPTNHTRDRFRVLLPTERLQLHHQSTHKYAIGHRFPLSFTNDGHAPMRMNS
jgi:hypothetical protein